MPPRVAALYRHPVKGFTPEPLDHVRLTPGETFPCDRLFAVEDGPSGFDPAQPAFVPKTRFTVLAKIPAVARVRTPYDDQTGLLQADAPGAPPFAASLHEPPGRDAFAGWLSAVLGEEASGPLKVIEGPGAHRFTDHPLGHVSLLNLATLRQLANRVGRPLDPLRFRANVLIEGLEPWAEMDWAAAAETKGEWIGRNVRLGDAQLTVFKPIVRCVATEVDPASGERDIETVKAIFDDQGHAYCGLYLHVTLGGEVRVGDPMEILP